MKYFLNYKFTLLILFAFTNSAYTENATSRARYRKIGDYIQLSVPIIVLAQSALIEKNVDYSKFLLALHATQTLVLVHKTVFEVPRRENQNNLQSSISGHTAIPVLRLQLIFYTLVVLKALSLHTYYQALSLAHGSTVAHIELMK